MDKKIDEIINHLNSIPELAHQFDCRFSETPIENISKDDIVDVALYTKDCFEEEDHYLYEGRFGYSNFNNDFKPNKELIKQYNQVKYFIKKWNN
tara:strand:+ start:52 stop:333 length:282 start_codon:yes stop_codon:yes gene_type:complete